MTMLMASQPMMRFPQFDWCGLLALNGHFTQRQQRRSRALDMAAEELKILSNPAELTCKRCAVPVRLGENFLACSAVLREHQNE